MLYVGLAAYVVLGSLIAGFAFGIDNWLPWYDLLFFGTCWPIFVLMAYGKRIAEWYKKHEQSDV